MANPHLYLVKRLEDATYNEDDLEASAVIYAMGRVAAEVEMSRAAKDSVSFTDESLRGIIQDSKLELEALWKSRIDYFVERTKYITMQDVKNIYPKFMTGVLQSALGTILAGILAYAIISNMDSISAIAHAISADVRAIFDRAGQ